MKFKLIFFIILLLSLSFVSAVSIEDDLDNGKKLKTDKEQKIKSYFGYLITIDDIDYEKTYFTDKGSKVYIFKLMTIDKTYTWITTKTKYEMVTK